MIIKIFGEDDFWYPQMARRVPPTAHGTHDSTNVVCTVLIRASARAAPVRNTCMRMRRMFDCSDLHGRKVAHASRGLPENSGP